jgi:squalene-hopene/tetraprenyl-beta-curcumene cyclase
MKSGPASRMALLLALLLLSACAARDAIVPSTWNRVAAAGYLDRRAGWWVGWRTAERDHQTFCISCHTALPYLLARHTFDSSRVPPPSPNLEGAIRGAVSRRVRLWTEVQPYYPAGEKAAESRGTEAVLNVLIMAEDAARSGDFGDDPRAAFANLWALQRIDGIRAGAWDWLDFGLEPWEAHNSDYYGASLAALAVAAAPGEYRSSPAIQSNLDRLRTYLDRNYSMQPLSNRIVLLWAASKWPALIDAARRESLMNEIFEQQRADGGWSLPVMVIRRANDPATTLKWRLLPPPSDAYATGLVIFVLRQAGLPRDDLHIRNGLSWLIRAQNQAEGSWPAQSLNRQRDPSSETGRFMTDAATAYAVLALTSVDPY